MASGRLPPSLYTGHGGLWYGISLGIVWVSCPGCASLLLVPLLTGRAWEPEMSLIRVSTAQQQLKHARVINIILILKPRHQILERKLTLFQLKPEHLEILQTPAEFSGCSGMLIRDFQGFEKHTL